MVKTRSQGSNPSVEIKEHATRSNSTRLLRSTNNNSSTSKAKNKVTKTTINKTSNPETPPTKRVALSDGQSTSTQIQKARHITKEQIKALIDLIVNKKMEIAPASRQVNMSSSSASEYYQMYLHDPEHKIPLPKGTLLDGVTKSYKTKDIQRLMHYIIEDKLPIQVAASKMNMGLRTATTYYERFKENKLDETISLQGQSIQVYTQEQITHLIHCIVNDKKSVLAASKVVKMSYASASKYAKIYHDDPEHKIPKPTLYGRENARRFTRDEIKKFLDYIIIDKMTISEASKKVDMSSATGSKYYRRYLKDTSTIPEPRKPIYSGIGACPQEKIKKLIHYIVDDEMSVSQASREAGMNITTGQKYYSRYMLDPNHEIPIPGAMNTQRNGRCLTDDQVREFFGSILNDKTTVSRAAFRANIAPDTANNYYTRVMRDIQEGREERIVCPKERAQKLFEYILVDGMSISSASRRAQMSERTARRYYKQYKNNPEGEIIIPETTFCTEDQIKKLIDIVNTEKITVVMAAKRVGMKRRTAQIYFKKYKADPEHKIPVPAKSKYNTRRDIYEGHLQIVTDIYNKAKENDTIAFPGVMMIKQEPTAASSSLAEPSTQKKSRKPKVNVARKSTRNSNSYDSDSSTTNSSNVDNSDEKSEGSEDSDDFDDSDASYNS